jgi:PIN domain nuclease of toxin-antitoxin system
LNLLLDTHIALWAITDSPRLPAQARALLLDAQNSVWVSAVSVWEVAIKHGLGRHEMPVSGQQALEHFKSAGYELLAITPEHAAAVGDLPAIHQDPFDRLLVAQALAVPMRLVTHDQIVASYGDMVILV